MRNALKIQVGRLSRFAVKSKKAIAGFIGPAVVVLAVPLTQLDLPSQADWKRAAGAAIGGLIAVYFAPKNAK